MKSGAASCEFSLFWSSLWGNNATLYSKWSLTGNDKHLQRLHRTLGSSRKCGVEGAKTVIRTRHLSPSSYRAATNQCDHSFWVGRYYPWFCWTFPSHQLTECWWRAPLALEREKALLLSKCSCSLLKRCLVGACLDFHFPVNSLFAEQSGGQFFLEVWFTLKQFQTDYPGFLISSHVRLLALLILIPSGRFIEEEKEDLMQSYQFSIYYQFLIWAAFSNVWKIKKFIFYKIHL